MHIQTRLETHRAKHLWRTRQPGYSVSPREIWMKDYGVCLNFSSNDYLGLSHHPHVKESAIKAIEQYGVGASASPFTGGYHVLHEALEERLKSWLNIQIPPNPPFIKGRIEPLIKGELKVILFSNGYLANVGVLQALSQRHGHIFMDKLAHASLLDGAQLSRATVHRFPHQDLESLNALLDPTGAQKELIVAEGVYSMDGDISPLPELLKLTQASKQRLLYVDDAHGFGVLAGGRGAWHHHALPADPQVIMMGTLSKALGSAGAFVACFDEAIYQTILQFTRTYLFNTALSPLCAAASLAAIDVIEQEPQLLKQLEKNIQFFKSLTKIPPTPPFTKGGIEPLDSLLLKKGEIDLNSPTLHRGGIDSPLCKRGVRGDFAIGTPIQPIIIGDSEKALQLSQALRKEQIWLQAIRPPTVPINTSRLRVTINAHHTESDLERLCTQLLKAGI